MHFLRSKKLKIFILSAVSTVLFSTCAFATDITATQNANVHESAKTSSDVVTVLKKGTKRTVLKTTSSGKWYKIKVNGETGYVRSKYVSVVTDVSDSDSMVNNNSNSSNETSTSFGIKACSVAKKYLGCNYVYGSAGKVINGVMSFDCSGFTSYVYNACGKSIPRTSREQYSKSTKVSQSNLQKGDLVFYATSGGSTVSHVGMYVGDGEFIHAANSKSGVIISKLSEKYYAQRYVGAGRY